MMRFIAKPKFEVGDVVEHQRGYFMSTLGTRGVPRDRGVIESRYWWFGWRYKGAFNFPYAMTFRGKECYLRKVDSHG